MRSKSWLLSKLPLGRACLSTELTQAASGCPIPFQSQHCYTYSKLRLERQVHCQVNFKFPAPESELERHIVVPVSFPLRLTRKQQQTCFALPRVLSSDRGYLSSSNTSVLSVSQLRVFETVMI